MTEHELSDEQLQSIASAVRKDRVSWKVSIPVIGSCVTAVFLWGVWVTSNVYETKAILMQIREIKLAASVLSGKVGGLPPDELRILPTQIMSIERRTMQLEMDSRENREAHTRLEKNQTAISTKLDTQLEAINKVETLVSKLHIPID